MNVYYVRNRHLVVPLTDEEFMELKVRAAKANLKIKYWVSRVIRRELEKEVS